MGTPVTITVELTVEVDSEEWADEFAVVDFDGNPASVNDVIIDAREHVTATVLDAVQNCGLSYMFTAVSARDTTDAVPATSQ